MVGQAQSGHVGSSMSIVDLVCFLYNTQDIAKEVGQGDIFILSKGHGVPAQYAALYELGLIETLDNFREFESPLQGHADSRFNPYVHACTGSLGQGLSIGVGHALGLKLKKSTNKVFVVMGDGEWDEGQIHEALISTPKLKLDNLVVFLDHNKFKSDSEIGTQAYQKITNLLGWESFALHGHDEKSLSYLFDKLLDFKNGKPKFIILYTIKGKDTPAENSLKAHSWIPKKEEANANG